uniref:Uncharacterized protein n=1 Tax=Arundo donax TaxID=35708 RepID=A0A0A9EWH1_ARUDO
MVQTKLLRHKQPFQLRHKGSNVYNVNEEFVAGFTVQNQHTTMPVQSFRSL